jgi:hypothetical protein
VWGEEVVYTHIERALSDVPNVPAVYVLFGGRGKKLHVAYVGESKKLKNRMSQHLVGRDSSVSTLTSATGLISDFVSEFEWYENPKFQDDDVRHAAELVAFDVFKPILRSKSYKRSKSSELYKDEAFRVEMKNLFWRTPPSGKVVIPTLQDALDKIKMLEKRVAELEKPKQKANP